MNSPRKSAWIAAATAVSLALVAAQSADACWWLFQRAAPSPAVPSFAGDSLADWEQAYRQSPFPARAPDGKPKAAPKAANSADPRPPPKMRRPDFARVDAAIALGKRTEFSGQTSPPWEVLHAVIAFGKDADLIDPATGRRTPAIAFLCERMQWNGVPVFCPAPGGIAVYQVEKHPNQFLAKLSCAGVPLTQPVAIYDARHTLADLLAAAKLAATTDGEVSWTLLAMCANLPIDASWKNARGQVLDIPALLAAELQYVPEDSACGGAHGLHAVSLALQKARAAKLPMTGVWQRAAQREDTYKVRARQGQNPDGSFSDNLFGTPTPPRDHERLIVSTGHVLEWLMLCQSDEEARQPWVARAAGRLADCLIEHSEKPGGRVSYCHALHALVVYRRRVLDSAR